MNGRRLATLMLVPMAALACAEQDGQQQMEEDTTSAMGQAADTAAAMAGQMANEVELAAVGESGVTGTAAWTAEGDSVTVTVGLEGVTEGEQYPSHVHNGTCQAGGGVATPLDPVTGAAGGTGETSTTVARSGFEAGGSYFVQAHLPDGTPAACGDLPSDAGLAPGGGNGM